MKKKANEKIDCIKESVCKFYIENKTNCDFHYYNAESKCIGEIYEKITDQKTVQQLFSQVSIVILTANKYEKNVLHYNIFVSQKEKVKKMEIDLFPCREVKGETYAYWFKWKGYTILHIEAQKTGSYTIGGSADIVRYVIYNEYICPTAIISLGICFGANERKNHLGDVIISKKVYPYFIGSKISESDYFVDDDNMFRVDTGLNARVKSVIDENAFRDQDVKVYYGNYITGEAVVSNMKVRDKFVKITKQEVHAGEMEGYGVFKECKSIDGLIPCIIIKSICDWAVVKNFDAKDIFHRLCDEKVKVTDEEQATLKGRIQAYAAFQAYNILDILLEKCVFDSSIYKKMVGYIERFDEKVIHANSIRNKIYQMVKGTKVSDSFALTILEQLVSNNILIYNGNDFNEEINYIGDRIWTYTFSVRKEK